ncbi:HobA family DNA replication regulator, partial [Nitratifractor sp.]
DTRRGWFGRYALGSINDPAKKRPFLPFYSLYALFPNLPVIESPRDVELLEDMLSISYPNGYFFWYIGEGDSPYARIVSNREDNFLWLIDEELPGSFTLSGSDPLLDIKLLQLYRLFERTLEAALFAEVPLG